MSASNPELWSPSRDIRLERARALSDEHLKAIRDALCKSCPVPSLRRVLQRTNMNKSSAHSAPESRTKVGTTQGIDRDRAQKTETCSVNHSRKSPKHMVSWRSRGNGSHPSEFQLGYIPCTDEYSGLFTHPMACARRGFGRLRGCSLDTMRRTRRRRRLVVSRLGWWAAYRRNPPPSPAEAYRVAKSESLAGTGAAGGCPGEGVPAVPDHRHEDGTMGNASAFPNNTASTFLTRFFGTGLVDERYVVERFRAHADGDIRPWPGEASAAGKGRRKAKRVTANLKSVKELRPTCTEIIICTGLRTRGGMQVWGGRDGPGRGPQAEGMSGVLQGRPAGATPAGRRSSGSHPRLRRGVRRRLELRDLDPFGELAAVVSGMEGKRLTYAALIAPNGRSSGARAVAVA